MKKLIVLLALVGSSALGQISPPPNPGGGGTGCVPGSTTNILKGNNAGGCVAATPGTDVLTSVSQFANTNNVVSPITSGLIGEYHLNEASGATNAVDYSGQGNNGTYVGTPTLTGTPAGGMISAGAGYLSYPSALNTALTFSAYTCSSALATNGATFPTLIAGLQTATAPTNSNLQAFGMMMLGNNATTFPGVPGKYDTTPTTFNSGSILTIGGQTTDGCHLITWVRGSSKDQFYIDGTEVTSYFAQPAGSSAVTIASGTFSLGMAPYGTLPQVAYAYPYPIYYSAVFSSALTATQINTLAGSVQTYAQLRGIVKAPAGFSDAGNQLLFVGDSITFGYLTTTPWPRTVTTAGNTVNTYIPITGAAGLTNNIASASWQLGNMIQECPSRGYGAMNPNSNTTVIIWGGTNDLGTPTQVSAATAYQRLRRLVQCYKAAPHNPRVFVMTMLSRTGNGFGGATLDSLKNSINDMMRKDWAGSDGLIDVASFPGMGADGSNANPTAACNGANCFNTDHVHPIDAGATIIASGVEGYINYADAVKSGSNPLLTTATAYQETAGDVAVNANPTGASQTITLPSLMGGSPAFLVGTERYIFNIQATGTNTVTIAAASGENIDGSSTLVCPNATKCSLRAVLGSSLGTSNADQLAGAHWERFGFSNSSGSSSGDATSIWSIPVGTAPSSGQVLTYNGTNITGATIAGGTVPTGTGYVHITSGAQDPAAAALPIGSSSAAGIMQCDGTSITCTGGLLTAVGGGGGAGLASNTFTGIQIMPSLQDTVVNDTGLVNAAVVANTSVTALSSGTIITFNPVAANTTTTPTLNVNSLGAKTITRFGNAALGANDLVIGTTAVVIYNSGGSGTWQLLNPAGSASINAAQTFAGTQTFSTINFTSSITKGGGGVNTVKGCAITTTLAAATNTCASTGVTTSSICTIAPGNAAAVTHLAIDQPFVTATANTITLTYLTSASVVAGDIFNAVCTIP